MDDYVTGFHGTNNLDLVLKQGIKPSLDVRGKYPNPVVFLTTDYMEAKRYADWYLLKGGIIKVKAPRTWVVAVEENIYWPQYVAFDYSDPEMMEFPRAGHQWIIIDRAIPPNMFIGARRGARLGYEGWLG